MLPATVVGEPFSRTSQARPLLLISYRPAHSYSQSYSQCFYCPCVDTPRPKRQHGKAWRFFRAQRSKKKPRLSGPKAHPWQHGLKNQGPFFKKFFGAKNLAQNAFQTHRACVADQKRSGRRQLCGPMYFEKLGEPLERLLSLFCEVRNELPSIRPLLKMQLFWQCCLCMVRSAAVRSGFASRMNGIGLIHAVGKYITLTRLKIIVRLSENTFRSHFVNGFHNPRPVIGSNQLNGIGSLKIMGTYIKAC